MILCWNICTPRFLASSSASGNTLTLKQSKDWIVGEAVCAWNVGTGDVDNDGVVEIVTVGCMQIENSRDCDPDLRIWSLPAASAPPASFPYLPVAVVGAAAAAPGRIRRPSSSAAVAGGPELGPFLQALAAGPANPGRPVNDASWR